MGEGGLGEGAATRETTIGAVVRQARALPQPLKRGQHGRRRAELATLNQLRLYARQRRGGPAEDEFEWNARRRTQALLQRAEVDAHDRRRQAREQQRRQRRHANKKSHSLNRNTKWSSATDKQSVVCVCAGRPRTEERETVSSRRERIDFISVK